MNNRWATAVKLAKEEFGFDDDYFKVYDGMLLTERDLIKFVIFSLRAQNKTWKEIGSLLNVNYTHAKRDYDKFVDSLPLRHSLNTSKARVTWYEKYRKKLSWTEYIRLENKILNYVGLTARTDFNHDVPSIYYKSWDNNKLFQELCPEKPDSDVRYCTDNDKLCDLIIDAVKYVIKMRKKLHEIVSVDRVDTRGNSMPLNDKE